MRDPFLEGYPRSCLIIVWCNVQSVSETKDGGRALHHAALHGHASVAAALLAAGASLEAEDYRRYRALHRAAWKGHLAVVETLIIAGGSGQGRLAAPSFGKHGHGPVLASLIAAGADLGAATHDGKNALQLAESGGNADALEVILAAYKQSRQLGLAAAEGGGGGRSGAAL